MINLMHVGTVFDVWNRNWSEQIVPNVWNRNGSEHIDGIWQV